MTGPDAHFVVEISSWFIYMYMGLKKVRIMQDNNNPLSYYNPVTFMGYGRVRVGFGLELGGKDPVRVRC